MGIADWFGRERDEPWRKFASMATVEAIDDDTGELIEIIPKSDDPNDVEGLLIGFSYRNASGADSTRAVLCHRAFRNGGEVYIRAFCTMREALRTFRVDRMIDVRELRGGRSITDPVAFFYGLSTYDEDAFDRRPSKSKRYIEFDEAAYRARLARESEARSRTLSGLKVLAYLSLSDGVRTEDEVRIEVSYIRERLSHDGLDDGGDLVAEMVFMAQGLAPTRRSYVIAIGKLAQDSEDLASVCRHAIDLVKIDGNMDEREREALALLLSTARKKRP